MSFFTKHRSIFIVVLVLLLAAAVVVLASKLAQRKEEKMERQMARRPQPVTAVTVQKTNLEVYLNALGTVTPLNTVTVRPQVGGPLIQLYFQEGQTVAKDDLLAQIDPRPYQVQLMQAEGQLARDEELLRNAKEDLARYRLLLKQDSIAAQQVTAQESLVKQYASVLQTDKAQVAGAKLQLSYSRILAPISGRVGLRLVDPGNLVSANDTVGIAVITQLQPIAVVFSVPQDKLPVILNHFRKADIMPVTALDQEGKTVLARGKLLAVDNQIDTATGTVKLKAVFRNANRQLFPNQFVNIRLKVDTLQDATVMSTDALQRGSIGTFAYVVDPNQTIVVRPIKLGPTHGEVVAVTEGLTPGEKVVTAGSDRLREGTKVFILEHPPAAGRENLKIDKKTP